MNELIQYVRVSRGKRRGMPRGVVMAIKTPAGKIRLGWSFTNLTAGDKFNKERGLTIARGRANCINLNENHSKIPHDAKPILNKMVARSKAVFNADLEYSHSVAFGKLD